MTTYLIIAVVSYLLGSIPFGYILVKAFKKQDIRQTGSGNIGATNVARSGAKGLGLLTLFLDAAKGWLAVVFAAMVSPDALTSLGSTVSRNPSIADLQSGDRTLYLGAAVAALFAILGHLHPVWLKFRGGKGVATAAGAFLVLAPKALLAVLITFALVVAVTRYVSLGSILAAGLFPVAAYFLSDFGMYWSCIALIALSSALIIAKHHENIRRLLAGTENRLGAKPKAPPPQEMEKQA